VKTEVKTESPLRFYLRILLVSIFIALIGLAPTPHVAGALLVKAYQSALTGDLLNAAQNLVDVANYYPWRVDLNLEAARYAFQAGNPKAAIQYFERPGTVSHLITDDLIMLGDAYNQSGNSPMAEAIWKHVIQLGDSSQAYQRLADLFLKQKDYASAVNYLQKLLYLNPSDINLYYQIGLLYAVTDPVKALPFLIQAAEIDPAKASLAQALHDKIRTSNLFEEPAYTFLIIGRQLANWGDWEMASVAFQRAVSLKPGYSDAWAFLGEARQQIILQETGSVSDAGLPELELAVQLDGNSILANMLMGFHWERQEDYPQAQQYLEHAIASSPNDPYLYSELGNILSKAGDLPAAQSAYESAIQLTPQDPLFYRLLAEFAMQNQIQIRELALPAARQAIILNPLDTSSLDVMAQVMLMLQDYHSAERYSLSAIKADPGFTPAYLHLGTAYLYLGESDLAHQWLGLAKTVDPESWAAAQAARMLAYYFP
jgi:tetratricopeptide (TPR) repeat protein